MTDKLKELLKASRIKNRQNQQEFKKSRPRYWNAYVKIHSEFDQPHPMLTWMLLSQDDDCPFWKDEIWPKVYHWEPDSGIKITFNDNEIDIELSASFVYHGTGFIRNRLTKLRGKDEDDEQPQDYAMFRQWIDPRAICFDDLMYNVKLLGYDQTSQDLIKLLWNNDNSYWYINTNSYVYSPDENNPWR